MTVFSKKGLLDMSEKFPTTEEFLIKTSLYKVYSISPDLYKNVYHLEFFNGTIDTYCIDCKQQSIFKGANINERNINAIPQSMLSAYGLPQKKSSMSPLIANLEVGRSIEDRIFSSTLVCTRNKNHRIFYFFLIKDKTITKFGQFPSIADINIGETKNYRKILGDKYKDFNKAIGLYSHGIGIGSFVYLRRIFESLIEETYQNSKIKLALTDGEYYAKKMDGKILLLKTQLPDFLVQNSGIYSILSKGIHSLSEEECLEYFDTIKVGIELILDEKNEKIEKQKKLDAISKDLKKIKGKISRQKLLQVKS